MRVLVCGGRDYKNQDLVFETLAKIHDKTPITLVIEGGANGADFWGGYWADQNFIPHLRVPADWNRYGRGAGPRRNLRMLDYKPELVIAFPGGAGTENMVKVALQNKVIVQRIEDKELGTGSTEAVNGCTESL